VTRARSDDRQMDLFVTALADVDLPLRDSRDLMAVPCFALQKHGRTKPITYDMGGLKIEVSAPAQIGLATIWDADLLIWATSQINEFKEQGLKHGPRLEFQPYDALRAIRRGTSGRDYQRLRAALDRLVSTVIRTNIRMADSQKFSTFHWLERWAEDVDPETGHSRGMIIELPAWLYEGVLEGRVLKVAPEYFEITGGIERWLYRLVRKHAGNQATGWRFTMKQLHTKSGSTQRFSDFALAVRKIAAEDDLPEYHVELYGGARDDECLHAVRRTLLAPGHPAHDPDLVKHMRNQRTRPRL